MAGVFGYSREAVRIKVQKCEGMMQPEYRKFSVDPQITSFEVLQSIIAKAFDLKGEFTVSYRAVDDYGQETYLSLLSDWDLDAAFLSASEPCLGLQIEAKPLQESSKEWDGEVPGEIDVMPSIRGLEALRLPQLQMQQLQGGGTHAVQSNSPNQYHPQNQQQIPPLHQQNRAQHRLPGLILNQVERTFNMVQRALNLGEELPPAPSSSALPPRPPLTDSEFRMFLDPIGQVVQDRELRGVIYYGGIEPSLRKVVWKHILNVYPEGMSGKERMDFMKKKAQEYNSLRDCWRDMIQKGQVTADLTYVTSMVRKDVLRTDRHHPYYAGSDDNQNVASLFNILTTYALNHPAVSYCQGMSDLASPLLVTMGDEAHAYICFCALMRRLRPNFLLDGEAMTLRFQHLSDGLMYYDPEFFSYLKSHQADDLLFCYRWLLLEMKREFAFEDALRMMEVMWSSLPPSAHSRIMPNSELPLFDTQFMAQPIGHTPPPVSPLLKTPRENAYTKVCALRRQGSAASLVSRSKQMGRVSAQRQNQSLDETGSGRVVPHKVKPFASLDDTTLERSVSLSTYPGDPSALPTSNGSVRKSKGSGSAKMPHSPTSLRSANAGITNIQHDSSLKKHFNEKFQTGRCQSLLLSLEKPDRQHAAISEESQDKKQENSRVVKNLNEFLNFSNLNKTNVSPNKTRPCDIKRVNTGSVDEINDSNSESALTKSPSINGLYSHCESIGSNSSSTLERGTSSDSSPDDSEYYPMTTSMTRELRLELDSLDRQVFGPSLMCSSLLSDDTEETESACCDSAQVGIDGDTTQIQYRKVVGSYLTAALQANNGTDDVFLWENPLKGSPLTPDEQAELEFDSGSKACVRTQGLHRGSGEFSSSSASGVKNSVPSSEPEVLVTSATNCKEAIELNCTRPLPAGAQVSRLPPPTEFGGGNPFLMFLCLTVLRQHRDFIMRNSMDYNEVAMHFDKMVRKHDVTRVLNQARIMYASYLKQYNNNNGSCGGSSGLSV